MSNFLLSLGWWNFLGSIVMLGLLNERFGKKMLNEWTKIFAVEFKLDYWGKLWLAWAAGLNIFFGLMNILSVKWQHENLMNFLVHFDIAAYLIFVALAIWGIKSGKCASGIYSALAIFAFWIGWGIVSIAALHR